jgi:NAD(P)-dependent dehydrogenase (short-subunit alcohol dehydrogenase family)
LSDPDQCKAIIAASIDEFGQIDGLVNAAGLTDRGTIFDTSVEFWDRMFAINTRAPFLLIQGAARQMKEQGTGGSIVNILSISGHGGQPFITSYCASKGALAVLTRNTANGLKWDRIRVNGINIGWTDTPNEHLVQTGDMGLDENWLEEAEAAQPFGRLLKPNDVAELSVFLLSDRSGIMTGSIIDQDQKIIGAWD